MAEKTLGYVELEWTCQRCGTKNPGTQKTCTNCGAAMSDQQQFDLPAQQELISDPTKLEAAAKGPDVHCPYCGTRNAAGSETCSQCGGDLKAAQARQKGQVMGAYAAGAAPEIRCPSCGTPNLANAARCTNCGGSLSAAPAKPAVQAAAASPAKRSPAALLILGVIALAACGALLFFLLMGARTEEISATVQSVAWQRSVEVLEQRPVEHEDWQDSIPSGVQPGSCESRHRRTQSEPAPGAEEVCGTPYTVDQGSGIGKVVQDCEYKIYEQWCTYTQPEWVVIDTLTSQGSDLNPLWPALSLGAEQRQGERYESYRVSFSGAGDSYTYTTSDPAEFAQFSPGSEWQLEVNAFGSVTVVR
jgi:predicted nucleic acid-binding Zn ribbon protein